MSPAYSYIFNLHKSFDILRDAYCGDHLMQGVSWLLAHVQRPCPQRQNIVLYGDRENEPLVK